MSNEDWRVEITLDEEQRGYDLGERLRSQDLDEEARERLGKRVYVSRNGLQLFLYTGSEEEARAAEDVVRNLITADGLTAQFRGMTRWHPVEQQWKDASIPLPRTAEEVSEERGRREDAERSEAAEQGSYDWVVKINLSGADDAKRIAETLEAADHPVERIWRWVTVHVLTDEIGNDLISSLKDALPDDAEIWLEANLDDEDAQLLPFVFRDPRMY
ncbi:MAG: hypothetical protein ACRDKU_06590 [Gaiellaceae bacterium]